MNFTNDPAPAGYHRTETEHLSIPVPEAWLAMSPTSPAFQFAAQRLGIPTTSDAFTGLRLYVEDPSAAHTVMVVTKPLLDASMLQQKTAVESTLRAWCRASCPTA